MFSVRRHNESDLNARVGSTLSGVQQLQRLSWRHYHALRASHATGARAHALHCLVTKLATFDVSRLNHDSG